MNGNAIRASSRNLTLLGIYCDSLYQHFVFTITSGGVRMGTIFVIEDDRSLCRELAHVLMLDGYKPCVCSDFATAADEALAKRCDLIILDLRLPGIDGLDLCRSIRKSSDVPILVLTSSDDEFDEIMSMKLGADDYVTKPYRPAVLLAHVARLLQRAYKNDGTFIEHAGVALDVARANVMYGDRSTGLSRNETCILAALIRSRGDIVSRQDLMRELWETDQFVDDNTLTVNVNRLRRSLVELGAPTDVVKTHRGRGYSL